MASSQTASSVREGLAFVQEVVSYAKAHGLNAEKAYRYYIPFAGRAVSYLVQAAEPDRMRRQNWWFPVVGDVPYLGFFEREDRDLKAMELQAAGLDVSKGHVSAFSSLGWFEDPIYSSMLRRSRVALMHLIFHELVHRTFWSQGSVRFNENLAEFLAEKLTRQFLASKKMTKESRLYILQRQDKALFRKWMKKMRLALEEYYKKNNKDSKGFEMGKAKIINLFQTKKFPQMQTKRFSYARNKSWNNASILGVSLYLPDMKKYETAYQCLGKDKSVQKFLQKMEEIEEDVDDAFIGLDLMCAK